MGDLSLSINYSLIEKYQILLEKDPKSKVFAPLSEAYRKMGLIEEALEVCERGIQYHPHFVSGRVAMANVFIAKSQWDKALENLSIAIENSPENILAHNLCAEIYLKRKNLKALKSYKMVLFLNPQHSKAQQAVKKLESITADEYDEDLFSMQPLSESPALLEPKPAESSSSPATPSTSGSATFKLVDRFVSLVDAHLARNDMERALYHLKRAEQELGPIPEIVKRKNLIHKYEQKEPTQMEVLKPVPPPISATEKKVKLLEHLLKKINSTKNILYEEPSYGEHK